MEEKRKKKRFIASLKLPLRRRERYVFTDKKHPEKGIMSTVLGVLSVFTVVYSIYMSFLNGGEAKSGYAAAVMLCLVYSVAGLVLGIISRLERDIFVLFPNLGIVLNVVAILGISALLILSFV